MTHGHTQFGGLGKKLTMQVAQHIAESAYWAFNSLDDAMKDESDQQTDLVRISGKSRSEFPEPTGATMARWRNIVGWSRHR